MSWHPSIASELHTLHLYLSQLPSCIPEGSTYGFDQYPGVDLDWVERTGTEAGALNHDLEVLLGTHANGPIVFRERGPALTAVVDVLGQYICGDEHQGENLLLHQWVADLLVSACKAFEGAGQEVGTLVLAVSK